MKTKIIKSDLNNKSNKFEKIIILDIIVIIISLAILAASVYFFLEWQNEKEKNSSLLSYMPLVRFQSKK